MRVGVWCLVPPPLPPGPQQGSLGEVTDLVNRKKLISHLEAK